MVPIGEEHIPISVEERTWETLKEVKARPILVVERLGSIYSPQLRKILAAEMLRAVRRRPKEAELGYS